MNMNTNEEFLLALANLQPIVEEPIEYRLHYDNAGNIITCTMRNHPDSTQYLVATFDEYSNYFNYNVVQGQLTKIDRAPNYSVKLKKSSTGHRVVKHHAGIILEDEIYSEIEYYDTNN